MNAEFAVAVHSLVFLARRGGTSTSEEIARSVCTHPARVRKVLSRLKKAQLVSSREGHQDGGYAAMRAAEDVTLLDVLNALETRVVPPIRPCADSDPDCLIASGMAGAMERLTGRLDDLCRGELARVSLADVQKEIFDSLKDGDNPSVGSADSSPLGKGNPSVGSADSSPLGKGNPSVGSADSSPLGKGSLLDSGTIV